MEDIERKLQDTVTTIAQSAENQGFRISVNKTYCMHFCRLRKVHQEPKIKLYGADINIKSSGRFLGLIFDRKPSTSKWFETSFRREGEERRTSPYAALCAEAGTPPLEYRRNYLLSNYYSKIHPLPSHPVHNILFEEEKEHQNYNQRRSRQLVTRINNLISELEEPTLNVYTFQHESPAPWLLEQPKIYLNCLKYDKNSTPRLMIENELHLILENHNNPTLIHTDGSKTRQGVERAAICSDSLSSLYKLKDVYTHDPLINIMRTTLQRIKSRNSDSHIHGNEMADKAAKEAVNVMEVNNSIIQAEDGNKFLKQRMLDLWQSEWNDTDTGLKHIKQRVQLQHLQST
ncbi:hypothetical protein JTB14_021074 [Gonioctena quinquepunctata]|nr:hypothetical protein JTB14_021074 [Gonioctena quinquepunctata]